MINRLKELFRDAHEKINKKEVEREDSKRGILRAGSCGALVDGKVFASSCGRLAQARLLGYQAEPTEEMRLMFNGGITLEEYIKDRFTVLGIQYTKERELSKEIFPGITVSGRPDFEIELENMQLGIEVKSLASPFTVTKHAKSKMPLMKHLLQASTYMLLTDKNYWLIVIGHSFYVNERGFKVEPSLSWYWIDYKTGRFFVTNENNETLQLPFDKTDIIAYYREVRDKTAQKTLMARPTEKELKVDSYDRCKYCHMQSACNEYDNNQIDFEQWLNRVKINK